MFHKMSNVIINYNSLSTLKTKKINFQFKKKISCERGMTTLYNDAGYPSTCFCPTNWSTLSITKLVGAFNNWSYPATPRS